MSGKINFEEAMLLLDSSVECLADTQRAAQHLAGDLDRRREWLQEMSYKLRQVSDAYGLVEDIVKAEGPPDCDLRVREGWARPGTIHDMDEMAVGWLTLVFVDGFVLEIKQRQGEWAHETHARFTQACSESPGEMLAILRDKSIT